MDPFQMFLNWVTLVALFVSSSAQFFGPPPCLGVACGPPLVMAPPPCVGIACAPPPAFAPPAPGPCLFGVIGCALPPPPLVVMAPPPPPPCVGVACASPPMVLSPPPVVFAPPPPPPVVMAPPPPPACIPCAGHRKFITLKAILNLELQRCP
ncbi:hypothetical protein QR680_011271 [Steinernema hermaphroditum]|uniref:VM domain-containing protein n=1 Tax=Steinernema hermaphroditum TaxID=289476 RepID=A0AA39MD25_9BILA|nr:hypothetical protein QR680_011271 [Steinernema hermaphroditum]